MGKTYFKYYFICYVSVIKFSFFKNSFSKLTLRDQTKLIRKTNMYQLGSDALKVSMKLFALNRQSLLKRLKSLPNLPKNSIVLLKSGVSDTRHCSDHEDVFRQESYFHWTFGVTEPDFYGAIEVDSGKAILFPPHLPAEYGVWMGKIQPASAYQAKYEVDEVHFSNEMVEVLTKKQPCTLLTLYGLNTDSGKYTVTTADFKGIENFTVDKDLLHRQICECRVFKSELELEVMRYTNKISSEAHKEIMRRVKPGAYEFQMESIFHDYCYRLGGMRHMSYTCICATGDNAAVLHYGHAGAPNDKKLTESELCLFDMGGEYYCYASDITCSYPSNGKFTQKQKFLYETVLKSNRAALNATKPGVHYMDLHILSDRVMLEEMVKEGLLVGDVDEMLEHRVSAVFQPHGLGHLIGIDTHDVGGYNVEGTVRSTKPGLKSLRLNRVLEAGMVLTIEPGIYFIDYLLDQAFADPVVSRFMVRERLEEYRGCGGVRIEDNVYVSETGFELLTDVPRTVQEIETFMQQENVYLKA